MESYVGWCMGARVDMGANLVLARWVSNSGIAGSVECIFSKGNTQVENLRKQM